MVILNRPTAIMDTCKLQFKRRQPKNVYEAVSPLRWLLCFFGLGIIHYPSNRPRVGLTIFYVILTVSAYLISLNYAITTGYNSQWFKDTESYLIVVVYVNVFLYLSNIVLVWIWARRAENIFNRLKKTDGILEKLKMPLDYRNIYVLSSKTVILFVTVNLIGSIIDLMWFMDTTDPFTNIKIVLVLLHPIRANSTVIIASSISINVMEERFKKINRFLSCIVERNKKELWGNVDRHCPKIPWTITGGDLCYNVSSRNRIYNILRITRHLHLEWTILSNESTVIFGLQLASQLAAAFVIVTGVTFASYTVIMSPVITGLKKIHQMIILAIWLVSNLALIIVINKLYGQIVTEQMKTGSILHELSIICKNNKERNEIRKFSLQLIQNPLLLTACGLVEFGHDFLLRFIGSATTYIVILVQMYNTPK